jgi:predicted ABC-type ATPase
MAFQAGRVMVSRMRELTREKKSFAFETTLATRVYGPWVRALQKEGYTFHLLFLWLRSSSLAIQRVRERVRLGGHAVEERVIRRRYDRGLRNFFELYLSLAKTWVMYDNSLLGLPDLIASGAGESKINIFQPELWKGIST